MLNLWKCSASYLEDESSPCLNALGTMQKGTTKSDLIIAIMTLVRKSAKYVSPQFYCSLEDPQMEVWKIGS